MRNELEFWSNIDCIHLDDDAAERLDKALSYIYSPDIQQFVVLALTRLGTNAKIGRAVEAMELGIKYMKARRLYHEQCPTKQSDTFFAALLLHNLWFDQTEHTRKDWLLLFSLRDDFEALANEMLGNTDSALQGAFEFIFQNVEAQLGEDMPTVGNRPVSGQNTYFFWEVLWFYYHAVLPLKK